MGILDPNFRYVPACRTDIRLTFKRERKRLADEARRERAAKVTAIKRKEAEK